MGFLDRLVSDLVADATGIKARNVRSVVRGVGLKNILMVGGAALAGGVAASQASQQGFPGVSSQPAPAGPPSAPPTLPPIPGSSLTTGSTSLPPLPSSPDHAATEELPPLPPSVTRADEEIQLSPEATFAVARTLVAAAMSDGHLGDEERKAVIENLESSDLSTEQRAQIQADLSSPLSPESLSLLASSDEDRLALYRFAAIMISSDGVVERAETAWLDRFARALGLSLAQTRDLSPEA